MPCALSNNQLKAVPGFVAFGINGLPQASR
jgi:hypothetical protein